MHKGYPSSAFGTFSPLRRGEGLSNCCHRERRVAQGAWENCPSRVPLPSQGERVAEGRVRGALGKHAQGLPLIRLRHLLPSAEGRRTLELLSSRASSRTRRLGELPLESPSPLARGEGGRRPGEGRSRETCTRATPHPPSAPSPLCGGEKDSRTAVIASVESHKALGRTAPRESLSPRKGRGWPKAG